RPRTLEEEHHPLAAREGGDARDALADAVALAAGLDHGDAARGGSLPGIADLPPPVGDEPAMVARPDRGGGGGVAAQPVGGGDECRSVESDGGASQGRAGAKKGQEEEGSHGPRRYSAWAGEVRGM